MVLPAISPRKYNSDLPLIVRRSFIFEGKQYKAGDEFDPEYHNVKLSPRKITNMIFSGKLTHDLKNTEFKVVRKPAASVAKEITESIKKETKPLEFDFQVDDDDTYALEQKLEESLSFDEVEEAPRKRGRPKKTEITETKTIKKKSSSKKSSKKKSSTKKSKRG